MIRMRFGLEPYAPMTLREVGENLGLTRERVRQLENQALERLTGVACSERPGESTPGPTRPSNPAPFAVVPDLRGRAPLASSHDADARASGKGERGSGQRVMVRTGI